MELLDTHCTASGMNWVAPLSGLICYHPDPLLKLQTNLFGNESSSTMSTTFHGTTILCVRHGKKIAMGGDGQVTMNNLVAKADGRKVRKIMEESGNPVLVGFAGAVADAFALLDQFENKLKETPSNMKRAAIELAKLWRTDRYLRRLESLLAVADSECSLLISGSGEVIEPSDGIIGIGSGGPYATAAARALVKHSKLDARGIVEEGLMVAGEMCVYTNTNLTIETL